MSIDDNFPPNTEPDIPAHSQTEPLSSSQPTSINPGKLRLSRRNLLIGAGAVGIAAAAISSGILLSRNGLHFGSASQQPAQQNQIAHLLRRAGFGGTLAEVQEYSALGTSGAIEHVLNYTTIQDDIDTRLTQLHLDLTKVVDMQRWWILRMIYSKRPLQEKMTLFWHGLLTSSYQKVGGMKGYAYIINQNQLLRNHALDSYDNILLNITSDPAMMWWLDLRLSRKNAPNENYARELMELFTLGVNGGYTQTDVHEAARALTGWTLTRTGTAVYDPAQHDTGSKTFLGHTGNLDYHDVIHIVAGHPATGPYLARRMFEFFVYEHPSDSDIKPMVDAYYANGHSILSVVRAMFNSPAFFSAAAYRSRVKSPLEYVVGAIRQIELEVQGQGLSESAAFMGQTVFAPPNVAGWPGDVASGNWINTGTWLTRVNFTNAVVFSPLARSGTTMLSLAGIQHIIQQQHITHSHDLIQYLANRFIDGAISNARLQSLQSYLTSSATGTTITLTGGETIATQKIQDVVYLILTSPEYQLN